MITGTKTDFGAARPSAGQAAYPPADPTVTRRPPGADRIAALSALVESITEQIDAIEGARRGAAQRPQQAQPAAPQAPVAAQPAYGARPEPQRPIENDRLGEIEARLAAIAGQMASREAAPRAAAPAPVPAEPTPAPRMEQPARLQSAIAEIAARQQAIDNEAGRLAAVDSIAIEDAITALRSDIATLGRRIGSEARRSEDMDKALRADIAARLDQGPRDDGGRFDELRRHLDEIRQAIAASARETTLASIEAGYSHVIERLDDIVRRVPERARVETLADEVGRLGSLIDRAQPFRSMEGELEDIRNAIASLAATRIDTGIERQIAELRLAVEHFIATPREQVDLGPLQSELAAIRREVDGFAKGTDPVLMLRLEQQVAAVHGMLEQIATRGSAAGDAAISRLEERIDALSGRFDAIVDLPGLQGGPAASFPDLEGLRGDISDIRRHVVEREPARFDAIDRQMQALMERLDAATKRDDGDTLAQLEAQVASLADRFAEASPAPDALSKVEENIGKLQELIGDSRRETIEAARDAARSTLSEFAGQIPAYPDEALIQALREDLRTLQTAALTSDRHNHETLEAVHDTLAKVVERIAQLEAGERGWSEPLPAAAPLDLPQRRQSDFPEDHRPLAPGSGKPDLSLRSEFFPAEEREGDAQQRTGDRKADFIAAARRAAQAAQAETARNVKAERKAAAVAAPAAAEAQGEEAEERPGALARLGNVLRRRRRPLLLAIAAVVLALGAAKYGPAVGQRVMTLSGVGSDFDVSATGSVATRKTPATASAQVTAPAMPAPVKVAAMSPQADAAPVRQATPSLALPPGQSAASETASAVPAMVAPSADAALAFEPASALASPMSATPAAAVMAAPAAPSAPALNVALVKRDAAKGDLVAAFALGKQYAEGIGVRPDLSLAAEWYQRAAKGGLAIAQYRIGSLYERGEGVKRDPAAAESWYRKASAAGNARATHNLAVMVSEGANGDADYVAAAHLFIEAADMGVADSQYNLGVLYARGLGMKVDLIQSYKWFALAAQQGDADAGNRRDEVAKVLSPAELASARAAVQAFAPKPLDPAVNQEPAPKAEWMVTASSSPLAGASLDAKG
ncbi:MAG: SEL1-like repeat protein [Bosea sp.]|nr:SEL1-like repeat protein [Bosea sp. (in: a-proteobacteria)]